MKKLTDEDLSTLSRAGELERRFDAGIFPTGAGQHRHFAKLERQGLIEFLDYGRDIDLAYDDDVPIYKLTDAGRAALKVSGKESE